MNQLLASNPPDAKLLMRFIRGHFDDEWTRLIREFSTLEHDLFTLQPAPKIHSIGWHVRHVVEWRYALVHVLICGKKNQEDLSCLGWENEPLIQSITRIHSWHEPSYTISEILQFAAVVRNITDEDLLSLPPSRYWDTVAFPWRTNRVLDEIFQDIRHSAVHRGQIREIKKTYFRRIVANSSSDIRGISLIGGHPVNVDNPLP